MTSCLPNFSRLSASKVDFLVRGIGCISKGDLVLELFGGSGLSTEIISKAGCKLVSVDIGYGQDGFAIHNTLIKGDARNLPFSDESFDFVVAPDSPRTRLNGAGESSGLEWGLTCEEQRDLFMGAVSESLRVLKYGGVFLCTAPVSWCRSVGGGKIIIGPSRALQFRWSDDPIVYFRKVKE